MSGLRLKTILLLITDRSYNFLPEGASDLKLHLEHHHLPSIHAVQGFFSDDIVRFANFSAKNLTEIG